MKLSELIKAAGFTIPNYQRPVLEALERGETVRMQTWNEQRRAQREAMRRVMADFHRFLGR